MASPRTDNAGITLLELLVVLAILSITAAVGAPPLADWLAERRVLATLDALRTDLQRARHEAVVRGAPVVACASADGDNCAGDDWSRGWLVFVNADDDSPAHRDAGEPVLAVQRPHPRIALAANRAAFSFRGDLRRATNGSVLACDAGAAVAPRLLVVSFTGRARIAAAGTATGALTCP